MEEKRFWVEIPFFSDDDSRAVGPCAERRSRKPKLGGLAFRLKIANISLAQKHYSLFQRAGFSMATWERLGGIFTIKDVSWDSRPDLIDLFSGGNNSTIYHQIYNGVDDWTNWETMGGTAPIVSKPTVISWGTNRIDAFGLGTD